MIFLCMLIGNFIWRLLFRNNFPVFECSAFYGTWGFVTVFTRSCHLFLSWAGWIWSTPANLISRRFISVLFSHLCQGLPSGLFLSSIPVKILYKFCNTLCMSLHPFHSRCFDNTNTLKSQLSNLNRTQGWSDNRKSLLIWRLIKKTVNIDSVYNSVYSIIKLQRKFDTA
jgi:hypothetical protein